MSQQIISRLRNELYDMQFYINNVQIHTLAYVE